LNIIDERELIRRTDLRGEEAEERLDLVRYWRAVNRNKWRILALVAAVAVIAALKAQSAKLSLQGSVVASDAFFPFRDGVEVLADAGARAVIQPGGSVRDEEVIAAANERGLAMVFTGVRVSCIA